ncbi:hypothetical protein IPG41_03705 [Candidatus Peregrinibacteria bacterium]|nr:MAG: hypothetical protein IPG41_03705 [Candidatus Peregrinibacteria bacterium]
MKNQKVFEQMLFPSTLIIFDGEKICIKKRVTERSCKLKDIVSMSFGGSLLPFNGYPLCGRYVLRLKNGDLFPVPLMWDFDTFEKLMEGRADLILEDESILNSFQFRIMTPKARRWSRKGIPYSKTDTADRLNPFYPNTGGLSCVFLAGFVLGMTALVCMIISSRV